ncbi:hypothetical protein [Candidatus Stoquefichus sp. SB1]|uniref:hypothetical protein n=1 Tax=Candidatus Stoquefichus sp. SB1 TaxID=1658109 RepID=UPI00067F1237|nr:hypothetical protein [Candidatus Stoquefichus sp. SB1]
MADGSIRINTKLDNDEVKGDIKDLEKMVSDCAKGMSRLFKGVTTDDLQQEINDLNKAIKENEQFIKDSEKQIQSYQNKLNNIDADKGMSSIKKEIEQSNKEIEKGKKKIEEYERKLDELDIKKSTITDDVIKNSRIGMNDTDENVDRRVEQSLSMNKDYQKLISQENELVAKIDEYSLGIKKAENNLSTLNKTLANTKETLSDDYSSNIKKLSEETDKARNKVEILSNKLQSLKKNLNMVKESEKTRSSLKDTTKETKNLGNTVVQTTDKGIRKLGRMALAIFSIRTAYTLVSKAANQYLQTNENMANQVQGIWTTMGNVLGPIINTIVGYISKFISYINAIVKALTGVDLIARANASALKNQANATKGVAKATKDANRQLASFDEMNKLNFDKDKSSSGGSDLQLFTPESLDVSGIADKMSKLFEPLKNAWANYGEDFTNSFNFALGEIWNLIKSIGKSFEEVWLNGTGELTCSLILQILIDIFNTIGNIARQFRIAWESAGVGTKIIQNVWDVVNILLDGVRKLTKSLSEWSGSINFTPILQSIEKLTDKLKPLTELISGAVLWAFENVLEPLGSWIIEDTLPATIDILSGALNILTSVLDALSGPAQTLWDNFLSPIANWTGGIIVTVLEGLAIVLETIGDWISDNQTAFTIMAVVAGSLATAFGLVRIASWIMVVGFNAASVAGGALSAVMTFLTSPIALVVAAIGAIIAIVSLLIIYWDDVSKAASDCWDWICEKWNQAGEFFSGILDSIHGVFDSIGQWFNDRFGEAYNSICTTFKDTGLFFTGVWSNIKSAFGNISEWFRSTFSKAWTAVKNVFSSGGKIFDGIKDGILNGLKVVINALISGINKVIAIPFNGINSALKSIRNISFLGISPFGFLGTISVPQIPKLAKGGIVNNPGPGVNMGNYIAGEKGPEAVMPITDSQFIADFAEEIAKRIDTSQPINIVLKIGDKEFYKWFINMKKKYDFVMGG